MTDGEVEVGEGRESVCSIDVISSFPRLDRQI